MREESYLNNGKFNIEKNQQLVAILNDAKSKLAEKK
jgi:hypothetical protein